MRGMSEIAPVYDYQVRLTHICYFVPVIVRKEFMFQCDCGKVLDYEEALKRINQIIPR